MSLCHPGHFLISAKRAEIAGLEQLVASSRLVSHILALIHELQLERGTSNLYLVSQGQRFSEQRLAQVANCLKTEQLFRSELEHFEHQLLSASGSIRLFNRLAWVLHSLDTTPALRHRIQQLDIAAAAATDVFSGLIAGLLSVVFEIAELAGDASITCQLMALFNLMRGKEYAGQERAWATIGFAAGAFESTVRERLQQLPHQQQQCFDVFMEFAPKAQTQTWQQYQTSHASHEFLRLRKMMANITTDQALPADLSEIWFELASHRIDQMQALECQLTRDLIALSEHRKTLADQELQDQKALLQTLTSAPAPTSLATAALNPHDQPSDDGMSPLFARSLYDLMAEQSAHLRQVSHELEQARQALDERKLLERAKGLLMQHQGLSDEQAWQLLRRTSMNSGKALRDIAESVISMLQAAS